MHLIARLAISFLIALATLAGCSGSAPTPTRTVAPTPTLPLVSAADLNAEYRANEVAAGRMHEGHDILVTGTVLKTGWVSVTVGVGILAATPYVALKEQVNCELDYFTALGEDLNIATGQKITLKGTVKGLNTQPSGSIFPHSGKVVLGGCTMSHVKQIGEEQVLASISAMGLSAEHEKDQGTAQARYSGQVLEVNGLVIAIGNIDRTTGRGEETTVSYYVTLESGGRWDIDCIFPTTRTGEITELANSQMVILKGRYDGLGNRAKRSAAPATSVVLRDCTVAEGT